MSGSDFAKFCVQLAQLGLSVREVEGDGNCMFRAIADQLDGSGATHGAWRRRVCRQMAAVPDDFAPFVVVEDGDEEEDSSFDAYLARMRSPGEWGGHLELRALVDAAHVSVVVHNFGAPRYVLHLDCKRGDTRPPRVVHLAYVSGSHYDSVRLATDDGDGPALPLPAELVGRLPPRAEEEEEGAPLDAVGARVKECSLCPSNALIRAALSAAGGVDEAAISLLVNAMAANGGEWEGVVVSPPAVAAPFAAAVAAAPAAGVAPAPRSAARRKGTRTRRPKRLAKRKPCHCGSGRRYMECHRDADEAARGGETVEASGGGRRGKSRRARSAAARAAADVDGAADAFGSLAI